MLKKIAQETLFYSNKGWLESKFHFSFAEYHNPSNIHFGVLRVLNDDIVHPNSGFDMHPHRDMEIISYIVEGEITHEDSMGNKGVLKRGEVQYMSAGTGVYHSEHNQHSSKDLRLLQIWILPPQKNLEPLYGQELYTKEQRLNQLLHIVSNDTGDAKVKIHQDVNMYVAEFDETKSITYDLLKNRQIYFVQIEGCSRINGIKLNERDAMEITNEAILYIDVKEGSHFLFIEMPKG